MPAVLNLPDVPPLIVAACCLCQRLRDHQGHWQMAAAVLAGSSPQIAFSHTICPECALMYYPEFYLPGQAGLDPQT